MIFTKEQAREAIRQHPQVARDMKLSVSEMRIYLNAEDFTTKSAAKAAFTSDQCGAIALKSLARKGYLIKLDKHRAIYGRVIHEKQTS